MCEDGECSQFCIRLNDVSVVDNYMSICASITVFGEPMKFPFEFCQTLEYSLCGTNNYFYSPCERVYASSIFWDGGYLASLDMPRISNSSLGNLKKKYFYFHGIYSISYVFYPRILSGRR